MLVLLRSYSRVQSLLIYVGTRSQIDVGIRSQMETQWSRILVFRASCVNAINQISMPLRAGQSCLATRDSLM